MKQTDNQQVKTSIIKRKRKAGGGRKPMYTSKCTWFTVCCPEAAKEEIMKAVRRESDKYLIKKE